ncbi:MAG: hypothetical protein SNJ29_07255 [Rikenellaceae bacterium]
MARTIDTIKTEIKENLASTFSLSTSAVAEWLLWVDCFAYCIYLFEVAMDTFKAEMDDDVAQEVAGTLDWYNSKCYEFQYGHELVFDTTTGQLGYATTDEDSKIVKIAAVSVEDYTIYFKVATQNESSEIVPLSDIEVINFKNYIDSIKFAGTKSQVISTDADSVRYDLLVYYNPTTPVATVEENIKTALEEFKSSQEFGGVLYTHLLIAAVTAVSGVVAAKLNSLESKSVEDEDYSDIDTMVTLHAGYYNFSDDSTVTLTSINEI